MFNSYVYRICGNIFPSPKKQWRKYKKNEPVVNDILKWISTVILWSNMTEINYIQDDEMTPSHYVSLISK